MPKGAHGSMLGAIAITLLRQVIQIAAILLLGIAVARVLGPEGAGSFAICALVASLGTLLLSLGVPVANAHFVSSGVVGEREAAIVSSRIVATLSIPLACAGIPLLWYGGPYIFPGVSPPLLLLALASVPPALLQQSTASLIYGREDFRRYNLAILAPVLATVAVLGGGLAAGWGLGAAVAAMPIGQTVGLVLTIILVGKPRRKGGAGGGADLAVGYLRRCLAYGWKAHLTVILNQLNYRIDIFLVNLMVSSAAVGIYTVPVYAGEAIWTLSGAAATVLFPRISASIGQEPDVGSLTARISRWVFALTIVVAAIAAITGDFFIILLFGTEFAAGYQPLLWLLPGLVIGAVSRVVANDLAGRGRPELNMYAGAAVVVVNICLNIVLIPEFGIVGAAVATSIAYALDGILKIFFFVRITARPWWSLFVSLSWLRSRPSTPT